jgi:hypothetical protein
MANERRSVANKQNAAKSTGPRTKGGKARSAANATKHGFSSRPEFDATTQKKIEGLASVLAGYPSTADDAKHRAIAYEAAEAHFVIHRIREARTLAWNQMALHPNIDKRGFYYGALHPDRRSTYEDRVWEGLLDFYKLSPTHFDRPFESDVERDAQILEQSSKNLVKFNRYEQMWIKRRDKALQRIR